MLGLWLAAGIAQASNAAVDGIVVGLGTAGFEVSSMALGAITLAPLSGGDILAGMVLMGTGGAAGAIGGGLAGSAVLPIAVGRQSGPAFRLTLATVGVGAGLAVAGAASGTPELALAGAVVGFAGMPIAAGIGAAGAKERRDLSPSASLAPEIGRDYRGLRLAGSF